MERKLREGLRRIADRVDRVQVQESEGLQDAAWAYRSLERIPVVMHGLTPPDWNLYPYAETFDNPEKMLWNQLREPYIGVCVRDDRMMNVRPNFWTAVIPSLFGIPFTMDEITTWVKPLNDPAAIEALIAKGVPDPCSGLGTRIFDLFAVYRDYLAQAGLSDLIHVFQADNQSPFDCACTIWGTGIYLALYDRPDLVHKLLDFLTETSVAFVRKMKEVMGEPNGSMYHWWYHVPAGIRIVDDATISLSPGMYDDFARPYNERLFQAFGGGYMHYCGHGLQAQRERTATLGLRGIEMGAGELAQKSPEYQLEPMCRQAAEKQVTICWIGPPSPLDRRPDVCTGLIYGHLDPKVPWEQAPSLAERIKDFWRNS